MKNLLNILQNAKKDGYQYVSTNADNDLMIDDVIADVDNSDQDDTTVEYQETMIDDDKGTINIYIIDDTGLRSSEVIYTLAKEAVWN